MLYTPSLFVLILPLRDFQALFSRCARHRRRSLHAVLLFGRVFLYFGTFRHHFPGVRYTGVDPCMPLPLWGHYPLPIPSLRYPAVLRGLSPHRLGLGLYFPLVGPFAFRVRASGTQWYVMAFGHSSFGTFLPGAFSASALLGAGAASRYGSALIRPRLRSRLGPRLPFAALGAISAAVFRRRRFVLVLPRVKDRAFLPLEGCGTRGEVLLGGSFWLSSPALRSRTLLLRKRKKKKKERKKKRKEEKTQK